MDSLIKNNARIRYDKSSKRMREFEAAVACPYYPAEAFLSL